MKKLLLFLFNMSLFSHFASASPDHTAFLKSSFCQKYGCVSQGTVQYDIQIYSLKSAKDVELRVYFLDNQAVGAAYVFPLADVWDDRAGQVASFFSTALHTKVSEARIKQFAQSPPSTVIQLADQKRLFTLSSDMTIPPDGQIHARVLHVKYGRQLRKEADRRILDE